MRKIMVDPIWTPHVTVATIAEQDGKFLMIREVIKGETVINQPAGHLERNETLIEAVVRETIEETQYDFTPTGLVGIYRSILDSEPDIETTYLRILFSGEVGEHFNGKLDQGIVSVEWMSYDEIKSSQKQHRSPLVMLSLDDYLKRAPCSLDVLSRIYA